MLIYDLRGRQSDILLTHLFEPKIFPLASGRGREDTARLCAFFSGQKETISAMKHDSKTYWPWAYRDPKRSRLLSDASQRAEDRGVAKVDRHTTYRATQNSSSIPSSVVSV